ncbi:hypothetical protein CBR_g36684 [Chara braunii]|uniref:DUS-like FMN-binding domain-containing protein n=1 Tax=Chara braunii TaxID=69332 RepID=A0A388LL97_CHABU|nr:hypothetical protein CBR_g36684 [Chara braunii]|eukprot:GBG83067.1 hypothetical protein CBR_g36684 [Chara braunii]
MDKVLARPGMAFRFASHSHSLPPPSPSPSPPLHHPRVNDAVPSPSSPTGNGFRPMTMTTPVAIHGADSTTPVDGLSLTTYAIMASSSSSSSSSSHSYYSSSSSPSLSSSFALSSLTSSLSGGGSSFEQGEEGQQEKEEPGGSFRARTSSRPAGGGHEAAHAAEAWAHFRKLGSPWRHVAPMVDQSELPFRMLCRKYGADAAYTPMLHSRLFVENAKYRREHFTTCPWQHLMLFHPQPRGEHYASDETLLRLYPSATCPQRIARRGNYGSFLMDDLPLVQRLVRALVEQVSVPVSCKIRIFPNLEDTLAYARMLESSGCSLLAVHGRTRDQKKCALIPADWNVIKAIKQSLSIPVLANGNMQSLKDVRRCIRYTGVDGVLSAEPLLCNPGLFSGIMLQQEPDPEGDWNVGMPDMADANAGSQAEQWRGHSESAGDMTNVSALQWDSDGSGGGTKVGVGNHNHISFLLEYLELCKRYPAHMRMVRGHVHRLLNGWFRVHTDLRSRLNQNERITVDWLIDLVLEMQRRNRLNPSLRPLPEKESQNQEGRRERVRSVSEWEEEELALEIGGVKRTGNLAKDTGTADSSNEVEDLQNHLPLEDCNIMTAIELSEAFGNCKLREPVDKDAGKTVEPAAVIVPAT